MSNEGSWECSCLKALKAGKRYERRSRIRQGGPGSGLHNGNDFTTSMCEHEFVPCPRCVSSGVSGPIPGPELTGSGGQGK